MSRKHTRDLAFGLVITLLGACSGEPEPALPTTLAEIQQLTMVEHGDPDPERMAQAERALLLLLEREESADALVELVGVKQGQAMLAHPPGSPTPRVPEAVALCRRALELDPGHPRARSSLVQLLGAAGEHHEILEITQHADPHREDHILLEQRGVSLLAMGRYEEAIAWFEEQERQVLQTPQRAQLAYIRQQLASAHRAMGNHDQAEAALQGAVEAFEQHRFDHGAPQAVACPYAALGELYRSSGNHQVGAEAWRQAADTEPHLAPSQLMAAITSYQAGELEHALDYAQRAVAAEDLPELRLLRDDIAAAIDSGASGSPTGELRLPPEVAFQLALLHFQVYEFPRARALLEDIDQAERRPHHLTMLGFLDLLEADYTTARQFFEATLAVEPDEPGAQAGLAHLLIIDHDFTAAASELSAIRERVLAGPRTHRDVRDYSWFVLKMVWLGLGWCASNQGEHEQAIPWFQRILEPLPDDRLALLGKGNAYNALGRYDEAAGVMRHVLRLEPDNKYAHAELGLVLLNQGQEDEAEQSFQRALDASDQPYTCPHEGLGLVYLRQGRLDEAKQSFERAIEANPDIEYEKYNGLARIHIEQGRPDLARPLLEKSIANYPYDNEAQQMLEQLDASGPEAESTAGD